MISKFLFFLITFALAGSQFERSSSKLLAAFNENIELGDIHSLQSLINTNSKYIMSKSAKQYRNDGLLLAIQKRDPSMVELLLKDANIDAASNNNRAINLASANGDVEIVRMLLNRPEVNPDPSINEALIEAAQNGHTEVVRLLLANPKVDPSTVGQRASYAASNGNHPEIVKLFINDERVSSKIYRVHTFVKAARSGNVDFVQYLLGRPSYSGVVNSFLITGDLTSIKTVVEAGYKMDSKIIERVLEDARSKGKNDVVEYLMALKEARTIPKSLMPIQSMTEQCAICLADDIVLAGYMTFCNHQFHVNCLQKWLEKQPSCPMCRTAIN
jgi:hypothetical protein